MKSLLLTALVAGASVSTLTPAIAKEKASHVVLVHGAFAEAGGWDKVKAGLVAKGYAVTAVEIPLTSLADDVAATRAAIDAEDGPVVLVGHSWGGVVIGEAGDSPKVRSLVYVAAFAPDQGESIELLSQGSPPSDGVKAIRPDARGYLTIDPAAFSAVFAADLPADEAQALAARQRAINAQSFGTASVVAAWKVKPSYYAVMTDDRTIPTQVQHLFAGRMKAATVEVKASHAGLVSQPDAIVAVIDTAAN